MLLHDPLIYWAKAQPDAPFLTDADRTISYGEGYALSQRIARALVANGIKPGARIATLMQNHAELVLSYYGASLAGVVFVPLNPRLSPVECLHIVSDADAVLVLGAADLIGGTGFIEGVHCDVVNVRGGDVPGSVRFEDWLASGDAVTELPDVRETDDLYQIYTSGTTGRPKGAVLTHLASSGNQQRWQLHGLRLDQGDKLYMAMPASLSAGMLTVINAIQNGAEIVLAHDFNAAAMVEALSEGGIAATAMAPTMVQRCLEIDGIEQRDFSRLKWILYGAAPMPGALLRRAMAVLGCEFCQGFGQTEAASISFLTAADHRQALAGAEHLLKSVGRPQMGVRLRIVDDSGAELPAGVPGEICVRGSFVMKEYWHAPELTAEVQRDGWHHTGDIGYLDDGWLYVVDRKKDVVISGGYNVYPREIERVIEGFAEVLQVAVIGVPSQMWGEEVKAIIRLAPRAHLTEPEVISRCRQVLGGYKVPKSVEFVDSFPLNANGKIVKAPLREKYAVRAHQTATD
jgi:acyl-CoA synthetase (AMP-forming)/AMP-acid ligase II